jgi:hypothetical protein
MAIPATFDRLRLPPLSEEANAAVLSVNEASPKEAGRSELDQCRKSFR